MRFQVLDGWRGIAAILVAVERLHAHGVLSTLPLIKYSYLFVDFFFVLSGFVIAHAYLERFDGPRSFAAFVIRRFGRLWPLHAAVLGAFVAMELLRALAASRGVVMETPPFTGDTSIPALFANLGLVQALGLFQGLTWNMPAWSISTEFWTYIVFALACHGARGRLTLVSLLIAGVSLAVVAAFSPKNMDTTFDFAIFRCLAGFFIGTLAYRLWSAMRASTDSVVAARAVWLEPAVVLAAFAFVSVAGRTELSLLAPLVFAAVVYVFAFEHGPVSKLMNARPFHAIGAWSYSIYMTAFFVALMTERVINTVTRKIGIEPWTMIPVDGVERRFMVFTTPGLADVLILGYLGVVLLVSWASYRFIEVPSRAAFAGLADRVEAGPHWRSARIAAE
jgi:peptidoglycan/LPS O-acetylase OafA/YrhL